MAQVIFSSINPATTSGNQLAQILNDFKDAVVSGFSGTSRPSELQEGGYWVDTTNDPILELKFYDGNTDITLFEIDKNTGRAAVLETSAQFEINKSSDDAVGPILKFSKERATGDQSTESGDLIGDLEFYGKRDDGQEVLQAKVEVSATEDTTSIAHGSSMIFSTKSNGSTAFTELLSLIGNEVGINNPSPEEALDVIGKFRLEQTSDDTVGATIKTVKGRTTGSQALSGDDIQSIDSYSTDQNGTEFEAANIKSTATENHTDSASGTKLEFFATDDGDTSPTSKMEIQDKIRPQVGIEGASVENPTRLDVKKDTEANLTTYASTASNGQLCFATDTKVYYTIVDGLLVEVGAGSGGGAAIEVNQTSHGFAVLEPIYHDGTEWASADASNSSSLAQFIVTEVEDADNFVAYKIGRVDVGSHGLTVGEYYYLDTTAGQITSTEPTTANSYFQTVLKVESSTVVLISVETPFEIGDGVSMSELTDTDVSGVSDGDALYYNGSTSKWETAPKSTETDLGEIDELDATPPVVSTSSEISNVEDMLFHGHRYKKTYNLAISFEFDLSTGTNTGFITIDLTSYNFFSGKTIDKVNGSFATDVSDGTTGTFIGGRIIKENSTTLRIEVTGEFKNTSNQFASGTLILKEA